LKKKLMSAWVDTAMLELEEEVKVAQINGAWKGTRIVVLSDQNGMYGGWNLHRTMPQFPSSAVHHVDNPMCGLFDLGQYNCMRQMDRVMRPLSEDSTVEKIVIHASSQGTATAMNYIAAFPHESRKVVLILLEGCMASSNATAASAMGVLNFPVLPLVLPFMAAWFFMLGHSPAGPQSLKSVTKWDARHCTTPVILLNGENDSDTPVDGARALAEQLVQKGVQEVYLFRLPGNRHVNLLENLPAANDYSQNEWPGARASHCNGIRYVPKNVAPTVELASVHLILRAHGLPFSPPALAPLLRSSIAVVGTSKVCVDTVLAGALQNLKTQHSVLTSNSANRQIQKRLTRNDKLLTVMWSVLVSWMSMAFWTTEPGSIAHSLMPILLVVYLVMPLVSFLAVCAMATFSKYCTCYPSRGIACDCHSSSAP
jgi:hypothetical protein